jgi:hypothetical protein
MQLNCSLSKLNCAFFVSFLLEYFHLKVWKKDNSGYKYGTFQTTEMLDFCFLIFFDFFVWKFFYHVGIFIKSRWKRKRETDKQMNFLRFLIKFQQMKYFVESSHQLFKKGLYRRYLWFAQNSIKLCVIQKNSKFLLRGCF